VAPSVSSGPVEAGAAASLDGFLAGVERRAFQQALFATGNREDALDVVQEAMLKLAQRYAERDAAEWPLLFQRVLQRRLVDWHRRAVVRRRVLGWLPRPADPGAPQPDPVQEAPDPRGTTPAEHAESSQAMTGLVDGIAALPLRQQQAFVLRVWEGFDVRQAAQAMGCSEGSVKTHYSRAVQRLRAVLGEYAE
jgi:RNA polymerase sigma-70 factor (ECF subfamily)